jgi:peroxiredoxin
LGAGVRQIGTAVGQIAPDFELPDADAKKFRLSEQRGKVVVLDFGGAWLQTSRQTGGPAQKLAEKFKDQSVLIVGVSCRDRVPEAAKELWAQERRAYRLLPAGDQAAKLLQVRTFPTLFVVGFEGEVLFRHAGFDAKTGEPFPAIATLIEAYLKDPKMPLPAPSGVGEGAPGARGPTARPTPPSTREGGTPDEANEAGGDDGTLIYAPTNSPARPPR